MSSYEHIHPDFRHVMALTDAERINFLQEHRWVGYAAANQVMDTLQALLHTPKRPRMPNLLIVTEPNNGKTSIVQRFHELCGQGYVNEDTEAVKPIILAQSPPRASEKELYIALLERFFTPYRATDPVAKLRYQVIHLCRSCHVRMIIIDEFHSLLTGTPRQQREVMNTLKLLCNELMIPIVGVGTRDAVRVLHTDPQHASRFDVMTLPVWVLDKDFQHLLAGFEKVLPLKHPSRLHRPELATLLHVISQGNIGDLHRLLRECAGEAIRSQQEYIDKNIVERKVWIRPTRGIRELIG